MKKDITHLGLDAHKERIYAAIDLPSDYGAARILLAVIGMLIVGGVRITHLDLLGADPMLLRFCALKRLPTDRTVVDLLKRFTEPTLLALSDLIRDLVYEQAERSKLRRLTIDLDDTVLRTGAKVDGAARGFNPHHPKDPSYYPLTAHLAKTGQIVRLWNRPGNVHDSNNAAGFLRVVFRELRGCFGGQMPLELRLDGLSSTDQHNGLAKADIFEYTEMFYNRTRRHSHLGGVSPEAFEIASIRGL